MCIAYTQRKSTLDKSGVHVSIKAAYERSIKAAMAIFAEGVRRFKSTVYVATIAAGTVAIVARASLALHYYNAASRRRVADVYNIHNIL